MHLQRFHLTLQQKAYTVKQCCARGVSHPSFDLPHGGQTIFAVLVSRFANPADLQGKRKDPQPALEGAYDVLEIGPFSIHFVDKRDRRDLVLLRRAPHRF